MAKSTKTYEERIRALEKKEQESIEATKKAHCTAKGTGKAKNRFHRTANLTEPVGSFFTFLGFLSLFQFLSLCNELFW